jgi:hypothetical protein
MWQAEVCPTFENVLWIALSFEVAFDGDGHAAGAGEAGEQGTHQV